MGTSKKTLIKRIEQRRKLIELFGGKCNKCGYCKNASALDFHHKDPKKKDGSIGMFINFHKFSDALSEAQKCILLCKNCHSEFHNPRLELKFDGFNVEYKDEEYSKISRSCIECSSYSGGQMYCSEQCANLTRMKVKDRPSKECLMSLLNNMSWCAIGRKYGVSDNAVRKWAKAYKLI